MAELQRRTYWLRRVQLMEVDDEGDMAQRSSVALGAAVSAALGDGLQRDLAAKVGEHPSKINRLIKGTHGDVTLDFVGRLEDALELPRGHLLRAAGFVVDPSTTREAVLADSALEETQKPILLAVYDSLVQVAAQQRARARRRHR